MEKTIKALTYLSFTLLITLASCGKDTETVIHDPTLGDSCQCIVDYPYGFSCQKVGQNLVFYPYKPIDVMYRMRCRK
jgi:hypothetical protein